MKNFWVGLAVLWLGVAAGAADEETVKVTGDRVSLRAAPDLNAVLLDRAMSGDTLVLKDNANPDWVGVLPPASIDLWVLGEYLEGGVVVPAKLNVRSGPSLSHSVVGVVTNGTQLTVRGQTADWRRIAPPPETTVWISRRFTEAKEPVVIVKVVPPPEPRKEPAVEIEAASDPEPPKKVEVAAEVPVVSETVKTVQRIATKKVIIKEIDSDRLKVDLSKEQGIESEFSGVLRFSGGVLYKLVNPDVEEIAVCYVRGNADQMKELEGYTLNVSGPAYWAVDLDMPFVRPAKITLLKQKKPLTQPEQKRF